MKINLEGKSRQLIARAIMVLLIVLLTIISASVAFAANGSSRTNSRRTLLNEAKDFTAEPETLGYAPNRVIVKFKAGLSGSQKNSAKKVAGLDGLFKRIGSAGKNKIEAYRLKNGVSVSQSIKRLKASGQVAYAEPDYAVKASTTFPDDTYYSEQWGLSNNGQTIEGQVGTVDADIDWPEAQSLLGPPAAMATVAVIDSGIDLTHPELSTKLWTNSGEIPGDGIDNDGNGFIDDMNGHNWAAISQIYSNDFLYFGSAAPDPYIPDVAQSFKGNGGFITSVGFQAVKYGSPSDGITVSIRSSLGGADLASATVPAAGIPGSLSYVEAQFPAAVKVNDGAQYYVVLHTNANDWFNSYALVYLASSNYYPNGSFWQNNAGWAEGADDDFLFYLNFDGESGRGGLPKDENGHGTHVSGIIGAAGNNSAGITGVAGYPDGAVNTMSLRALNTDGSGWTSDVADAVYYAADNGADIINMSLGGGGYSAAFQDAINYAYGKGVAVVAAAGNNGDTTMNYPAGYNNVIGVGATDNQDQIAWFSNYNSSVDVAAPGVNIYSTMPTYLCNFSEVYGDSLNFEYLSGTSMATPMTAGLAALIRSVNPAATPDQIQQYIQNGADDKGVPGRDDYYGYGRINARASLSLMPNSAPAAIIDSVTPNPAVQGQSVVFTGHGIDPNAGDSIIAYNWRSSIDGQLSTAASFSSSNLSVGTHTIYFKAQDNNGAWSPELSTQLVVNSEVTAIIDSITPNPSTKGKKVTFVGHGTDIAGGSIVAYNWRSSKNGQLSTAASFSSSSLSRGTHTIYFKAQNSSGVWSPEVSRQVVVNKAPAKKKKKTKLKLSARPKKTKLPGKKVVLRGTLKDNKGKGLKRKKIIIKAGKKKIKTVTTRAGGKFRFKIKPKKKMRFKAIFKGTKKYRASKSQSATVKVRKK